MYIVNTTATAVDEGAKVVGFITALGGKVIKEEFIGKKKLAYKIGKAVEGVYSVVNFSLDKDKIIEFRKKIALNENIIRSLITVYV